MEKIAFLFPGQGSQYIGMTKSLSDRYEIARQTFEEANDILGFALDRLCFDGSLADLGKIENSLVALLVTSVVSFRVYMQQIGIAPQFCAGHSLGEFSALTCSGALRFADAVKIVHLRGKLAREMADKGIGAMTIIDGIQSEVIAAECARQSTPEQPVAISCYNSANQAAISGTQEAVSKVEERILELGGQVTPLFDNAPFHCPLMQSAADQLRAELQKYQFYYIKWPVIANITGLPYENQDKIVETLSAQLVRPVQWQKTMHFLQKYGITLAVELGVKNVLSALIKTETKGINGLSFDQKEDRQALFDFFAHNELYRKHVPTVITKCLAIAVATPNTNWNNDEYHQGITEPYRRIKAMQEELEEKEIQPSVAQMQEALEMLRSVFNTKKVPLLEQIEWYQQIFDETATNYLFRDFEMPVPVAEKDSYSS